MTQVTTAPRANEMIDKLRLEAARNPLFNAVCHVFAIRERARSQVTVSNLRITMAQEGFHMNREECQALVGFLANAGVGKLDVDAKGQVRSIKDIKYTLQSVGKAALAGNASLEKFAPRANFVDLPEPKGLAPVPPIAAAAPVPLKAKTPVSLPLIKAQHIPASFAATLTVKLQNNAVDFEIPGGITAAELGLMLVEFRMKAAKK